MIGLKLKQVSFSYNNDPALRGLNLTVQPGEMVALLGPNGSGKTTLIKLASGVLKPGQGEIWLDGLRFSDLTRRRVARTLAVVPQNFSLSFAFTVEQVILLGRTPFMGALGSDTAVDCQVVSHICELLGLGRLRTRRFDELSGGERQKVVLAMALAQQPELLLLDEPTLHLDISHQVEILELVRRLNKERGLTVIAAVHDLNLAALYFDRLILLKNGMLEADGSPTEVLTQTRIRDVFATSVEVKLHPATGRPHVVVMPKHRYNGQLGEGAAQEDS